ncbi:MAG: hypothetical protein JW969_11170 [Spirochaetales bacterium]|nr:hypothetical protein [Spirochaetales bacterium]
MNFKGEAPLGYTLDFYPSGINNSEGIFRIPYIRSELIVKKAIILILLIHSACQPLLNRTVEYRLSGTAAKTYVMCVYDNYTRLAHFYNPTLPWSYTCNLSTGETAHIDARNLGAFTENLTAEIWVDSILQATITKTKIEDPLND